MLDQSPSFTADDVCTIARTHFGIDAQASALPSERDQNWLLTTPDQRRSVLKLANATESRALIEAQQGAMAACHAGDDQALTSLVPRVITARNGAPIVQTEGREGRTHLAWMISAVDGRPLHGVRWRSPQLYQALGKASANLTLALAKFDHPAVHRDFYWDIANAGRAIDAHRALVSDFTIRAAIDALTDSYGLFTAPRLGTLSRSTVHGDLNDHNILMGGGTDPAHRDQDVTGVVDFGDMVHSYTIADLAIVLAYVMIDAEEPLLAAAEVVRGRHQRLPLTEDEMGALFGLACSRLAMSACIAADQQARRPDNDYLAVTQPSIQRALPGLAMVPFAFAEGVFRQACGLDASPTRDRIVRWLQAHALTIPPILGVDLALQPPLVLDWSIASPMLSADERENTEPDITERVFAAMRKAGVPVAIGRYDEPRLLYVSAAFANGGRVTDERRTVHIGLDLFAEAGTPVYAPFAGRVHAFADNDAPCDFGPVIILEHATDDGTPFYTLYGHLSRESLKGLKVGQPIRAGKKFARLGTPDVNGNWTPHLHLGIMADMFGLGTEFPVVARPSFRQEWLSFCPDPNLIAGIPASQFPAPAPTKSATLAARHAVLGGNLSVAYHDPVKIVRGWRQYLFDDEGRRFIDAYNNVPHVGHCHPRVVEAGATQMRVLNTNTRYLHDLVAAYAERLAATLPAPLEVCYFLNSATEANELALRLGRSHTGARDMIVLDGAYHGNSTSLIDLSPYKHAGPGGAGAPDWVHTVPVADVYRGLYRRADPVAGAKYAKHVSDAISTLEGNGRRLSGFIAESCPSVGGQLLFPPGYLADVYRYVRTAGGICIADEVQTGLGRMGTHFWGFEAQDVVPDIVVMGKPLGNGHPIGAVVTTRAIADSFDNGMEFFSTFGGNTVSCAIGLAVLDVLRDEQLQHHALRIGERLLDRLRPLMTRHSLVGDVRGSGLFLGVELVRNRDTLEPAGAEASFVVNRMREHGVLAGTDGPHHNVVKIRPPMPIEEGDADQIVAELDRALGMLAPP